MSLTKISASVSGSPQLLVMKWAGDWREYHARMNPSKLPFPRNLLPDTPGLMLEDAHYIDHEMVVVL